MLVHSTSVLADGVSDGGISFIRACGMLMYTSEASVLTVQGSPLSTVHLEARQRRPHLYLLINDHINSASAALDTKHLLNDLLKSRECTKKKT